MNEVEFYLHYLSHNSLALIFWPLDSKQNNEIIESVNRKIKSMTHKRFEIELREKERPINEKVFVALYEKRIGRKVLKLHFLCKC